MGLEIFDSEEAMVCILSMTHNLQASTIKDFLIKHFVWKDLNI